MMHAKKNLVVSFKALCFFMLLTGILYPLLVTGFAQLLFPEQADGSLIESEGKVIGSRFIAQNFPDPRYFHSRASATDFATLPSGASNLSPTSRMLAAALVERRNLLGDGAPADLLTSSGSGLDPHISPEAAQFQVERIAKARRLAEDERKQLIRLVAESTEPRQLLFLGKERVNVLLLNLKVDETLSMRSP